MPSAHLIVCEKTNRWAAAFRGALREGKVRIVETRSPGQCEEALRSAPASLAAVEVSTGTLEAVMELLERASRAWPAARIVALLDSGTESAEPLLREAGAVEVLTTTREAPALVRLARRHLALAPPADLGLRQTIAARLPWAGWKTEGFDKTKSVA